VEPCFYIMDTASQKAYLEPFLPLANRMWSWTGQAVLANGEQTLDAWVAFFCHLRNASNTNNKEEVTKEGREAYFAKEVDAGLQHFTTAMKTPGGRGVLSPLTSPKRLQIGEAYNKEASSALSNALPQGPQVMDLKHTLALAKGELGTRDADMPYITVHGGIQGLWTGLGILEVGHDKQGETLCVCQDRVDHLMTDTRAASGKSNKALHAMEQLANMGGNTKVSQLESQLAIILAKVMEMEATLHKASSFVMDLSAYVSTFPTSQGPVSSGATVPMEDFLGFKVAHAQSLTPIQ
jgi:hypothetical protein